MERQLCVSDCHLTASLIESDSMKTLTFITVLVSLLFCEKSEGCSRLFMILRLIVTQTCLSHCSENVSADCHCVYVTPNKSDKYDSTMTTIEFLYPSLHIFKIQIKIKVETTQ